MIRMGEVFGLVAKKLWLCYITVPADGWGLQMLVALLCGAAPRSPGQRDRPGRVCPRGAGQRGRLYCAVLCPCLTPGKKMGSAEPLMCPALGSPAFIGSVLSFTTFSQDLNFQYLSRC